MKSQQNGEESLHDDDDDDDDGGGGDDDDDDDDDDINIDIDININININTFLRILSGPLKQEPTLTSRCFCHCQFNACLHDRVIHA